MWLTRQAIARPLLTALLTVALVVLGVVNGSRLPVDLNPQADLATLTVTCILPGAAPAAVENLVAKPLEAVLKSAPSVQHVFTVSQDSFCYAFLDLPLGTDAKDAASSCREVLAANRAQFPQAMAEPIVARLDINAQPVLFLGLVGPESPEDLRRLAVDVVEPRLRAVQGVSAVEVLGGRTREVAVDVDRDKLSNSGLLLGRIADILNGANVDAPGGDLVDGPRQRGVRVLGSFTSLDDLRGTPLPPPDDPGKAIEQAMRPQPPQPVSRAQRLGDIAVVSLKAVDPEVRVRLQQQPAVGVIVTKSGAGNTIRIADAALTAARTAPLPADVKVLTARDTARTVAEALSDVGTSLVLAILLCSAAMWLFLRNGRATLIVCCTIPVCLLGALAPMAWGGHSLNQMTLLGLAISIGILVDDSIVCIEAITHRLHLGEPAAQAAFNGRNDIALADTSTTLLDIAVYGPIAFMAGTVGQFFRDFGFVVAVSAALSLLAAYSIVPAMAARFYRERPPALDAPDDGLFAKVRVRYDAVLHWALDHRALTLLLGWSGLAVAGLIAWHSLGIDFIPAADLSTVVVNLELPAGSSPQATEQKVAAAEQIIGDEPDVETLFTTLGRIDVGFGIVQRQGPGYAQINVTLRDRRGMLDDLLMRDGKMRLRTDDEVAASLRAKLRGVPGVTFEVIAVHGWGGAGAPIDFSLYGRDAERLAAAGQEVLDGLHALPGLLDPDRAWRLGEPEVRVTVDRDRARDLYVYPGVVAREVRCALAGEECGHYALGDDMVPIKLRLRGLDRRQASDVARLPVGRSASRVVTVADVASVESGAGPTRIDRRDGLRDLNFKAYLAAGVTLGEAQKAIEQVTSRVGIPRENQPAPTTKPRYPELQWGWRGDASTLAESTGAMLTTAFIGLTLAYLVMAVLFNSVLHPLTILLSVPMAGTGGLLLLALTGSSLSIVSGIGFILLIGIVVRNAILLLDHTLHLRREGVARREAVERAGRRRLRPILMTTFTTTVGMLPVALRIGKGAEIRAPMAIAVIGGLLLSTVLTLIIIPVTYTLLDDWLGRPESPPVAAE
jgi:HAE1 family hydrophobic/amphiphilic exporter-1